MQWPSSCTLTSRDKGRWEQAPLKPALAVLPGAALIYRAGYPGIEIVTSLPGQILGTLELKRDQGTEFRTSFMDSMDSSLEN